MAEKLILNAAMNRKADFYEPKKCVVEKVIDVYETEFKKMLEKPMENNYYLAPYKDLMGFYDGTYHGVLFVNMDSGDGFLVNSEGYDYARYSQYIPNAQGIIQRHEQTKALDDLKTHMDSCIDKWLKKCESESKFGIPLTDLINDSNLGELFVNYASEVLSSDPRIETCELTHNIIDVTKRELTETKFYCPLKTMIDDEEYSDFTEIDPSCYTDYCSEINEYILDDLNYDEKAVERGLAAYLHDEELNKKVYSIIPKVEVRDGDLYGTFVVKSYGELNKVELVDITQELIGQAADGWGEGFEQHSITLGDDEVYISFWNSDDDYFLKLESEAFPEQKFEQVMG